VDECKALGEGPRGSHAPGVRHALPGGAWRGRRGSWQGLTLVHFSAQLEPCLTQETTLRTLRTLNTPLTRATQPLRAPPILYKALKLSSKVNECKPLGGGSAGGGGDRDHLSSAGTVAPQLTSRESSGGYGAGGTERTGGGGSSRAGGGGGGGNGNGGGGGGGGGGGRGLSALGYLPPAPGPGPGGGHGGVGGGSSSARGDHHLPGVGGGLELAAEALTAGAYTRPLFSST